MNAWCIVWIIIYLMAFAFFWSLCIVAGRADEAMERMMSKPKKYRPSNGTEGMIFQSQFCDRCKRDAEFQKTQVGGCGILARTLGYGIDDPEYPEEWIWNPDKCLENGLEFGTEFSPRCTAFEATAEMRDE